MTDEAKAHRVRISKDGEVPGRYYSSIALPIPSLSVGGTFIKIFWIVVLVLMLSAPCGAAEVPLVNLCESAPETIKVLIKTKQGLLYEKQIKRLTYTYLYENGDKVTLPYKVPGLEDSRPFDEKVAEIKFRHPYVTFGLSMMSGTIGRVTVALP